MMRTIFFYRLTVLLVCSLAVTRVQASEGKPVSPVMGRVLTGMSDTVPPVKQAVPATVPAPDPKQDKPVVADVKIIKVVPKAKKQIKPKVLPALPVKPPKVIKPIIKKIGVILP
jgi:hypothetical protein